MADAAFTNGIRIWRIFIIVQMKVKNELQGLHDFRLPLDGLSQRAQLGANAAPHSANDSLGDNKGCLQPWLLAGRPPRPLPSRCRPLQGRVLLGCKSGCSHHSSHWPVLRRLLLLVLLHLQGLLQEMRLGVRLCRSGNPASSSATDEGRGSTGALGAVPGRDEGGVDGSRVFDDWNFRLNPGDCYAGRKADPSRWILPQRWNGGNSESRTRMLRASG